MGSSCVQLSGLLMSSLGWISIIIATATNDWVVTCKYSMHTCKKMDELEAKGLWADCVISTALYHCVALNQILTLPAHIQTARALMISASLLGLPAVALILTGTPCIILGQEVDGGKHKRATLGGILVLFIALCTIVSTIWFPIGANQEETLMSFGFSLYAGWVGAVLCLLGSAQVICCHDNRNNQPENRLYYSKGSVVASNHAKSAQV